MQVQILPGLPSLKEHSCLSTRRKKLVSCGMIDIVIALTTAALVVSLARGDIQLAVCSAVLLLIEFWLVDQVDRYR